jgi:hypothetical protein
MEKMMLWKQGMSKFPLQKQSMDVVLTYISIPLLSQRVLRLQLL